MRREKRSKKRAWEKQQPPGSDANGTPVVALGGPKATNTAVNDEEKDSLSVDGDGDANFSGEEDDDWAEYAKEKKQAKKNARAQQSSGFAGL